MDKTTSDKVRGDEQMSRREYSKCVRCGRTIDVTNAVFEKGQTIGYIRDLCNQCANVLSKKR